MKYKFTFDGDTSLRLDVYLANVTDFSRSSVKSSITNSNVKVNGVVINKSSFELKVSDKVEFYKEDEKKVVFKKQKKELDIIFEDEYILVINKPWDLVVHPGSGNYENTLSNFVHGYLDSYPYLVHRLDKDTSGVIVFAKDEITMTSLQKQWSSRSVQKYYQALVSGHLSSKKGLIDSPISRDKKNRTQMVVSSVQSARESKTEFSVVSEFTDSSLVDVTLHTGRTHQIRVHFQAIGHSVIGDSVYGNSKINKIYKNEYGLVRQFLHASKLIFTHPKTGNEVVLKAELPEDLQEVLDELIINSTNQKK